MSYYYYVLLLCIFISISNNLCKAVITLPGNLLVFISWNPELSTIWSVSGSRYMARLRSIGADWGLDTRIRCGFNKHLYLISCINAHNHYTCIRLLKTCCTARKMALFIISQDCQTQVLAANAMTTTIIIDKMPWFPWSLSLAMYSIASACN